MARVSCQGNPVQVLVIELGRYAEFFSFFNWIDVSCRVYAGAD
jgi:hypothetical protein